MYLVRAAGICAPNPVTPPSRASAATTVSSAPNPLGFTSLGRWERGPYGRSCYGARSCGEVPKVPQLGKIAHSWMGRKTGLEPPIVQLSRPLRTDEDFVQWRLRLEETSPLSRSGTPA
jgi:hypothetical protein